MGFGDWIKIKSDNNIDPNTIIVSSADTKVVKATEWNAKDYSFQINTKPIIVDNQPKNFTWTVNGVTSSNNIYDSKHATTVCNICGQSYFANGVGAPQEIAEWEKEHFDAIHNDLEAKLVKENTKIKNHNQQMMGMVREFIALCPNEDCSTCKHAKMHLDVWEAKDDS